MFVETNKELSQEKEGGRTVEEIGGRLVGVECHSDFPILSEF